MRFAKGSIVISEDGDVPLLREVRNSKFVSRDQLFWLLNVNGDLSRSTYFYRLERLLRRDYVRTLPGLCWQGSVVYSIARPGLLALEGHGDLNLVLHSRTRHLPKPYRAYHALELNEIRLALARSSLLAGWLSGLQIASTNLLVSKFQQDYDALVNIGVGDKIHEFALEYHRSLATAGTYRTMRDALGAEREVASVLYLTPSADLMLVLLGELTPNS